MGNKDQLVSMVEDLIKEINMADITSHSSSDDYLKSIIEMLSILKEGIHSGEVPPSKESSLGIRRAIIESDELAFKQNIYNKAKAIDDYYLENCKSWN